MFRKGLKNNVKNELLCYKKIINNIKSLFRAVIKVNNKLYKKAIKKSLITYVKKLIFIRAI